jgi:hypothetical protein
MTKKKIRQVLRHGSWLYDGTIKSDIWIIRQNYFEGPEITDEETDPSYPPTDSEGCFYFPEYRIPGAGGGSGGRVFGSADDAIDHAEKRLGIGIVWDKISN